MYSKHVENPTRPSICCHITLLEIIVRKQATNDKLQGSVATYSRCGGVIKNQVKKTKFAESASEKNVYNR